MLNVTLYLTKDFQVYLTDLTVCIASNVKLMWTHNVLRRPYNCMDSWLMLFSLMETEHREELLNTDFSHSLCDGHPSGSLMNHDKCLDGWDEEDGTQALTQIRGGGNHLICISFS